MREPCLPIEALKQIGCDINAFSVYDCCAYSVPELMYKVLQKLSDTIDQVISFNTNVDDEIKKLQKEIDELLKGGINDAVIKRLNEWFMDGTLEDLINKNIFKDLNNKIDKAKRRIYVDDFGAKGDGNTDDSTAIENAFNSAKNGDVIIFGKGKIYNITRPVCNLQIDDLEINGNQSTLMLANMSGYLTYIAFNDNPNRDIIRIEGNNNLIHDLNFNGNYLYNFIVAGGEKYYGYHPDLPKVDGIPVKQIFYTVFTINGNNNVLQRLNCTQVAGGSINIGDTSKELSRDNIVRDCVFSKNFRGVLGFFNTNGTQVYRNKFYHNNRHNIQFYTMNINGYVEDNYIYNHGDDFIKWYPTWSNHNDDTETLGVSLAHPSYHDNSENFIVRNNKIFGDDGYLKVGIALRNYVKNVDVINNEIECTYQGLFINRGVRGIINFKGNHIARCESGFRLDLDISNPPTNQKEEYVKIYFEDNYNGGLTSFEINNTNDEQILKSYAKLEMYINNNRFYGDITFNKFNSQIYTNNPTIDIILGKNTIGDKKKGYINKFLTSRMIRITHEDNTHILSNNDANGWGRVAHVRCLNNQVVVINGIIKSYSSVTKPFKNEFSILINRKGEGDNTVEIAIGDIVGNLTNNYLNVIEYERNSTYSDFIVYIHKGDYFDVEFDKSTEYGNTGVVEYIGDYKTFANIQENVVQQWTSSKE